MSLQHDPFKYNDTCCVKGCGNKSAWRYVVKIWAKGIPKRKHEPLTFALSATCCHQHKEGLHIKDMTRLDELANDIARKLNLRQPDVKTAKVEALPLIVV